MANMKRRKGDVALQQSVINIALIVVAALMILLAVWFAQKAISKGSVRQQESFNNLLKQLQNVGSSGYDEDGKTYGTIILTLDKGYRIYGFSESTLQAGKDTISKPAVCGDQPCFCICDRVKCDRDKDAKLVNCRISEGIPASKYVATPDMRHNEGKDYGSDGKYFALAGSFEKMLVHFMFNSKNNVLTFSDKPLN